MQAQRVAEKEGSPAGRLLFLDNLRLTIIILVIGMHADDTHRRFGAKPRKTFVDNQAASPSS